MKVIILEGRYESDGQMINRYQPVIIKDGEPTFSLKNHTIQFAFYEEWEHHDKDKHLEAKLNALNNVVDVLNTMVMEVKTLKSKLVEEYENTM